jgi:hypothetical protein
MVFRCNGVQGVKGRLLYAFYVVPKIHADLAEYQRYVDREKDVAKSHCADVDRSNDQILSAVRHVVQLMNQSHDGVRRRNATDHKCRIRHFA